MNFEVSRLELLGCMPRTLVRALVRVASKAGIVPAFAFRTGPGNIMILDKGMRLSLYIKWRGNRLSRMQWTTAPELFSPQLKRVSLRRATALIADEETPRQTIEVYRKIDPVVS